MIQLTVCVTTSDRDRVSVLDTLRRLVEPTRVLSGCSCCDLFQDAQDPNRIALLERWQDEAALNRHLRSRPFRAVLAALDLAVEQPDIQFDWVAQGRGLDYVEQTLRTGAGVESEASQ
jgi:quinol monooxygenase YgiN